MDEKVDLLSKVDRYNLSRTDLQRFAIVAMSVFLAIYDYINFRSGQISRVADFSTFYQAEVIAVGAIVLLIAISFFSGRVQKQLSLIVFFGFLTLFLLNALGGFIRGADFVHVVLTFAIFITLCFSYFEAKIIIAFYLFSSFLLYIFDVYHATAQVEVALEILYLYVIVGFILVITQSVRIQQTKSLATSDIYLKALFNSVRETVFLINPKTLKVRNYNQTAIKQFKPKDRELEGMNVAEFIAQKDLQIFSTACNLIATLQGYWEGEVKVHKPSGIEFSSIIALNYLKIQDEELVYMSIRDISILKQTEESLEVSVSDINKKNQELEESKKAILNILEDVVYERANALSKEQKLTAILESIIEGVVVVEKNKTISLVNDAAAKLSGYTRKELEGSKFSEVLHFEQEETHKPADEFIDKAFDGKPISVFGKMVLVKKNKDAVAVSQSAAPVFDQKGGVSKCVIVFRDMTAIRKMEQMKDEFISVASHQLRTPITSIRWYIELLLGDQKHKLTAEQKQSMDIIYGSTLQMIDLVNDLLNVSRIETGRKFSIVLKKENLLKTIDEAIAEEVVYAKQHNVEIVYEKPKNKEIIANIDNDKIKQALMNLINNAIKYSGSSKNVDIKLRLNEHRVHIDIADHGIGIPEDQQTRIFERFFRAENAQKTETEGTGLGLYIARSITQGNGGDIAFTSKAGKGTTFTLTLPV